MATLVADNSYFTPSSGTPNESAGQHTANETPIPALVNNILNTFQVQHNSGLRASDCSRKVLEFILVEYPEKATNLKELSDITVQGYEEILLLFERFSDQITCKPKLSYLDLSSTLLLEIPSSLHDTPCVVFSPVFQKFIEDLPGKGTHLGASIRTAYEIRYRKTVLIPDITVFIANPMAVVSMIPIIGEVTFSQSRNSVIQKIKNTLKARPEILMVLLVEIDEENFRSPIHIKRLQNTQ